jgi:NADH-quinone oxidoreductase subunit F
MVKKLSSSHELEELRNSLLRRRDVTKLRICLGTGCRASGAERVLTAFKKEMKKQGLTPNVEGIKETGCHGFCEKGPLVVANGDILYQKVTPNDVEEIVRQTLINGKIIERLLYVDPLTNEKVLREDKVPFYEKQKRLLLANNGKIDPTSIEDYLSVGGYGSLSKVLGSLTPDDVVNEIKRSGLRGRGGAGFPTGTKWEMLSRANDDTKYLVCNADEGDPGAYCNRSLLEGNPHSVIEGMIIGGYATGANEGIIYVRNEYPLAVKHLASAIEAARGLGLLGQNILGSELSFDLRISLGAGAFVSGEETALMASIEGKKGVPRQRPPFPVERGVWGKPTIINNVETWANIPLILSKGAGWYSKIGIEKNTGTKIFSLVGKVRNTGLVEVPLGTTLGEIIYDMGGGLPNGKKFKGVQTGGPSGGCLPAELLNSPLDYETLKKSGSMMGSGGMIVIDDDTCVVDLARYFLRFLQDESCGRCFSCRKGIQRMIEILTKICEGNGKPSDLELLEELATVVKDVSLCALGQTAPNPLLSTLRYFRDEYDAHIIDKRCPAGTCQALSKSPCQNACPVELDIPGYIAFIKEGKFEEAYHVIKQRLPFPSICGRVCHRPCEAKCSRMQVDDAIAIKHLKRFVADYAFEHEISYVPKIEEKRKEKVAVVGGGPAGLTAAYELARQGYGVTVFEALHAAGGMISLIPEYRLPKKVIREEIRAVERLGVDIKLNSRVDDAAELLKKGYEAVFIATGAYEGLKMGIPGEDLTGVFDAIEFLKSEEAAIKGKVIVVGGGNSAIDSARVALRRGAEEVHLLYRRERRDMPAIPEEIEAAEDEGIHIHCLSLPTKILGKKGRVAGVQCIRMELKEFDKSGRRVPHPMEGSEHIIQADAVVVAIGQRPAPPITDTQIALTQRRTIVADSRTLQTGMKGVFAGGDAVGGEGTVIEAISQGQKAAFSIKRYLEGNTIAPRIEKREDEETFDLPLPEEEKEIKRTPRTPPKLIELKRRISSFDECVAGYDPEQAVEEARRCLRCDVKEEKQVVVTTKVRSR